jgi:hypothetical protein
VIIARRTAADDNTPPYGRLGRFDERLAFLFNRNNEFFGSCRCEPVTGHVPPAL